MDVLADYDCLQDAEEIAHQIQPYVSVFVASEDDMYGYGFNFDKWCGDLAAKPSMTAAQLGADMVNLYAKEYGPSATATLAAINMSKEPALADSLDAFAEAAIAAADWSTISAARAASCNYRHGDPGGGCIDMGTFINYVSLHTTNANLSSAADAVLKAYKAAVIKNYSSTDDGGTGISILVIKDTKMWSTLEGDYNADNFSFLKDPDWVDFMSAYSAGLEAEAGARAAVRPWLAPRRWRRLFRSRRKRCRPGPLTIIFSQCSARPSRRP